MTGGGTQGAGRRTPVELDDAMTATLDGQDAIAASERRRGAGGCRPSSTSSVR